MTGGAELHETHVSIVLLFGDRAVKLKKPVRFPFIDLSTRELRERACHREVELNRRLAPDVYLGVADIHGPDGDVCDHLVVMRRMPDDRRLSTLVADHDVTDDQIVQLARILATFHSHAETSPTISASARRDAVRERWEAGFTEIEPFLGSVLDRDAEAEIEELASGYLAGRAPLFDRRIAEGRIVDGHGDLLAGDIFLLPDGPRVLDCLEFDDQLRYGDVLADVAFLAMDLEHLGAGDLASRFPASYRELSGETHPASLEHHYIAYRAHVRAKVACLRGDPASLDEARELHEMTLGHLRRSRVTLTLVGGEPGSGKSTLAAGLGDGTGWTVLRSDEVRKDLAGVGHATGMAAGIDAGIYTPRATAEAYAEMLTRSRRLLEQGESVILDATWGNARERGSATELASTTSSALVEIRCDAPQPVREQRIGHRARLGSDASDATVEVARELAGRADPWPTAITVDTAHGIDATRAAGLQAIGPR